MFPCLPFYLCSAFSGLFIIICCFTFLTFLVFITNHRLFFQAILLGVREMILSTLRHMITPRQLLLSPLTFHAGMQSSFLVSEMTRAYGSCMLGVEQVQDDCSNTDINRFKYFQSI